MKAAIVWEAGGSFSIAHDVQRRAVGVGQVAVRIRAAGVCQTDITLARGGFGQRHPVVLGHEGAGEVIEVGPGVTTHKVGDRVVLSWVPSCGHCYHCLRAETYICATRPSSNERGLDNADLHSAGRAVLAGMGTATFAEETVVAASAAIPIPPDLPFELAALLGCAVPTGLGAALNSAAIRPGETVLVVGCGAVGLNAIQGARISGAARVVAVDPTPLRRTHALKFGATDVHAQLDDDEVKAAAPIGFDVVIDAVGNAKTIRGAWDRARRGGRVVVVGAGKADDPVTFSALELFHAEKRLVGSFYGSAHMPLEVPRMVALWRAGRLDLAGLVDAVVPIERINEVVDRQSSGAALRIIVTP